MANVGQRPTVSDRDETTLEVHVIDGEGDWYGQLLHLRWVQWMRGEVKFASQEELIEALHLDRTKARTLLAGCQPGGL